MRIRPILTAAVVVHVGLATAFAADTFLRLGESSYLQSGHMAYVFKEGDVRKIHLVKITGGEPQTLFTKQLDEPAGAPILVPGAVILVDAGGKMLKLDYTGKVLFEGDIPGFKGASMFGGRLDPTRIYVQNTFENKTGGGLSYQVLIVDVSKNEPVVLQRHPTRQFLKTFRDYPDTLYLFGTDGVDKIRF
jgi:hypothetical protein